MSHPLANKLGRKRAPDHRDFAFRIARPQATTLQRKLWSPGPILDQGDTPSCVGHGLHKWLTMIPVRNTPHLTPIQLYEEAKKVDEWPGEDYDGTSVRAGFKVAASLGFVAEYNWAYDIQTVANYVLQTGPIVFGTNWIESMFDPAPFETIRQGSTKAHTYQFIQALNDSPVAGGHCYVVNGIDRLLPCPDGSKGAARILNSWGSGWGEGGEAYTSLLDLEKLLLTNGEACTAKEI